jgi:hypothetical protein
MNQSEEVRNYLRKKYIHHRINLTPQEIYMYEMFDPWKNPDDDYIPYCSECLRTFEEYKIKCSDKCEIKHNPSCLWYDYFVGKIKKLNPDVKIIIKKK